MKNAIAALRIALPNRAEAVNEILDFMDEDPEPEGQFATLGNLLMLIGEPGVGKSACIDILLQRAANPARILVVKLRSNASPRSLMENMLSAIHEPYADAGESSDRRSRVVEAVNGKYDLIIFDEIQYFLDKSRHQRVNYKAAQYLRDLMEEIRIPGLLVGPPAATKVFSDDHEVELGRRVRHYIWLDPFSSDDAEDMKDFLAALRAFENCLNLPAASNLTARRKSMFILEQSKGRIGLIAKLLVRAGHLTVDYGLPAISEQILRRAAIDVRVDDFKKRAA